MAFLDIYGSQTLFLEQDGAALEVTNTNAASSVLRKFPFGAYFDRSAGWLPPTSKAIARFNSRLTEKRLLFEKNMDPRQADVLLDEWESAYGLVPADGQTIDDRRDALLSKVRNIGGVTAAYYEAVAADFGYGDAVVTDAADPFTTISECDDFLMGGEWKLVFNVTAASQTAVRDQLLQDLINGQLLAGWFAIYEFT